LSAFSNDDRRVTLISVMVVFALSAMSQTVVATAMPRIVAELSGLHLYAWATTAYMLASTVTVPIWGKLGDVLGRKTVLLIGVSVFLVGAWLAGLAGEAAHLPLLGGGMTQLIAFRAVQGVGGGALFTTALAIIADLYAPRERAKFSGLFGSVYGLFSVAGPVVGGFLTDHGTVHLFGQTIAGWRWVFYVNVPFALPALFLIFFKMPSLPVRREARIDYLGAILIVTAFVPFLLAITWGGRDHAWASPLIIGLFVLSAVALTAFIFVERAVWDPVLPLELFKNRTFTTANSASFFYGMAFMGVSSFLPLYMQVGQGVPATRSGLTMLALMGGMISSSTLNGQFVTRTGRYKPFMIGGGLVFFLGVFLLTFIGPDTSTPDLAWRLLVVGIGLGPGQSLFSLAVQNAMPPHQLGVATASSQFVRQIGQTVGVALFGAVLTSTLASEMARHPPPGGAVVRELDLGDLQRMAMARKAHPNMTVSPQDQAMERLVRQGFSTAIVHCLYFGLGILGLGFVVMLKVPEAPLREHHDEAVAEAESRRDDAAA
jgi:EmrB/QacA subfamily drug resistance transporter